MHIHIHIHIHMMAGLLYTMIKTKRMKTRAYTHTYTHTHDGRLVIHDDQDEEDEDAWNRSGSPRLQRHTSKSKGMTKRVTFSREMNRRDKNVRLPNI